MRLYFVREAPSNTTGEFSTQADGVGQAGMAPSCGPAGRDGGEPSWHLGQRPQWSQCPLGCLAEPGVREQWQGCPAHGLKSAVGVVATVSQGAHSRILLHSA